MQPIDTLGMETEEKPLKRSSLRRNLLLIILIILLSGLTYVAVYFFTKLRLITSTAEPLAVASPSSPTPAAVHKTVAFYLINFDDNASVRPTSPAKIEQDLFNRPDSLTAFWNQVSGGSLKLTGRAYDWVSIHRTPGNACNYESWAVQARAAIAKREPAEQAADYQVYSVYAPIDCPSMSSPIGEGGTEAYVNLNTIGDDQYIRSSYFHELGHLIGQLQHSGSIKTCPTGTLGRRYELNNCDISDYGDDSDVMGGEGAPAVRLFNSYHMAELGFIPTAQIIPLTTGGDYVLSSNTKSANATRLIRIPLTMLHLTTNTPQWPYYLYIEQRSSLPPFDNFDPSNEVVRGISLYIGHDFKRSGAEELKNSPIYRVMQKNSGFGPTFSSTLLTGREYTDPTGQLTITNLEKTSEGTKIRVKFNF